VFLLCKVCVAEIFGSIRRNSKKNDSLLLMVTKEHLAVSGCLQRAFHSFLGMFFQNISIALVKHPDVLRKIVQKFFGLWASFSFSAGKSVCFRGKILYFLREYLSDAAVYLLKRSFEDYHISLEKSFPRVEERFCN